ncbi:Light-dependent short hypocotyls protein [Thalictrum thalictroides]|uniref:Light-dependent short hypocotyls protein n=1 Tax=Thalictrum thalictroides TaxID=46969 RepID=A0A7J6VB59_THATH|nr:Light-dependent short hypocotyls protein [Thalictrum thalictroides]
MMDFSTPSGGGGGPSSLEPKPTTESIHFATPPITEGTSRRYEMQKRRDMKTFLQYLKNHEPPLLLARCGDEEIVDFLKHMDQFGKTKMHLSSCKFFGKSNIPKSSVVLVTCDCPFKQAWGSLDSLVGRLRAAFEENGGNPELNPFGTKVVRMYLKQVKEEQAKARGMPFEKRRKKSGATVSPSTVIVTKGIPDISDVIDGRSDCSGAIAGVSTSNAGGVLTIQGIPSEKKRKQPTTSCASMSMKGVQMVDGSGYDGVGCGTGRGGEGGHNGPDVCSGGVSTSVAGGVVTVEVPVSTPDTDGVVSVKKTNMRFVAKTPVEVSIRDKQCPGAWFPATVLKEIDSRLFLVGYQSLRLGDAEGCSKEIVDSLHIRPSPPDSLQRKEFNVLEKVDVYYDGGWWSGQITDVLASNRYLVRFKHQKIRKEFDLFELRRHMEWVNGKWVQDSSQTMEQRFITGTPVEVRTRDKRCHGAWFPATIVKDFDHHLFLVGYKSLRLSDKEECSKEIVEVQHIRPSPPEILERKEFHVFEKVDAYYDCGWWSGKVAEVLAGNRYIVHVKHQMKGREFSQSELRCHMEWINGKWVQDSRDIGAEPNQCDFQKIDQPQQSQIGSTSVINEIVNESNTRKRKSVQYPIEPCKKSQKGEVRESSTLIADLQRTMPARIMIESGTLSDVSEALSDVSEALSDHPTTGFGQEKLKIVANCEVSDNPPKCFDSGSWAQCESAKTQDWLVQKTLAVQPHNTKNLCGDDINTQHNQVKVGSDQAHLLPGCNSANIANEPNTRKLQIERLAPKSNTSEISPHCKMLMTRETTETSFLTAIPEKEMPTISHQTQELSDHPPSNVGLEDSGNVVDCDRFGSHPIMDDLNVSPYINIEEDQCGSSKTLLQCSEQNLGLQSLPDSTVRPGQQKCKHRGTRWCCHEMASSGNQYCEKHLLEHNIRQEKRRKRPREQSCVPVDVFQPLICSNEKGTFVDSSLSPLSTFEGAQCDSSKSQVHYLENDCAVQPHSIKSLGDHDLDTEHNQVYVRSDQTHLLLPCNSADIGTESNTRNQQIEQPTPKSNNSEILPPFEMVKTGETTETSLVLIENGKQEMATYPSPSEGLRYPAPNFGECSDNGLDTDWFGSDPIDESSISPPSNIKGQCDTSRTKVQPSQETLTLQSPPDKSEQQKCIRKSARWHCSEMAVPGKQHCEKHLMDQSIRNEKRRKRPGEKTRLSVGPFLPLVQQQCRRTGTGWRCHETALPEKRYCEKHQLIKDIYNEKRRKNTRKPSLFSVGPFLPSVQQQCRRTGTGWRCHEMALLGKRYCEKHQLGKDIYNEKRRKKEQTSNENTEIVKRTSIEGVGEAVDLEGEGEGTESTSTRPEGM